MSSRKPKGRPQSSRNNIMGEDDRPSSSDPKDDRPGSENVTDDRVPSDPGEDGDDRVRS